MKAWQTTVNKPKGKNTESQMTIPSTLTAACGGTLNLTPETVKHLEAHPEAGRLLEEAAAKVSLPQSSFLLTTIEFDRVIGSSGLVKAQDPTTLHFCLRPGRTVPSRVCPGKEPEPTAQFTLIAGKDQQGNWVLWTGFPGPSAPREPSDPFFADKRDSDEFRASVHFWSENGLCVGGEWPEPFVSTWEEVLSQA